jgi:hypothetical protein
MIEHIGGCQSICGISFYISREHRGMNRIPWLRLHTEEPQNTAAEMGFLISCGTGGVYDALWRDMTPFPAHEHLISIGRVQTIGSMSDVRWAEVEPMIRAWIEGDFSIWTPNRTPEHA